VARPESNALLFRQYREILDVSGKNAGAISGDVDDADLLTCLDDARAIRSRRTLGQPDFGQYRFAST